MVWQLVEDREFVVEAAEFGVPRPYGALPERARALLEERVLPRLLGAVPAFVDALDDAPLEDLLCGASDGAVWQEALWDWVNGAAVQPLCLLTLPYGLIAELAAFFPGDGDLDYRDEDSLRRAFFDDTHGDFLGVHMAAAAKCTLLAYAAMRTAEAVRLHVGEPLSGEPLSGEPLKAAA